MTDTKADKIREAKREYYREWRRKNPERVATIQERFWQKKAVALRHGSAADNHLGKCETRGSEAAEPAE